MAPMKFGIAVAFLTVLAGTVSADSVDDAIAKLVKDRNTPGIAYTVLKNGKPIKTKCLGFADLEHRVPVKPETVFQSGSVGKQFTATLIMQLVQDGKLALDDSIRKWLPEGPAEWNAVTIRHMLGHLSGLRTLPYGTMDMRKDYSESDLVELMAKISPANKPGEKWAYNNGAYVLLGIIANRATGKFYGDLLQEKLFGPLKMETARIIREQPIIPNRAKGYERNGRGDLVNQMWVSPSLNTTADGSLYISILDMQKWDAGLWQAKILPQSALELMWISGKTNDGKETGYGFGWGVAKVKGHQIVQHNGAWQGFHTSIVRDRTSQVTAIALVNVAASARSEADQVTGMLMEAYVPELKGEFIKPGKP